MLGYCFEAKEQSFGDAGAYQSAREEVEIECDLPRSNPK